MKLRLRGDTLRLRLTRSEVRRAAEQGLVEEATGFAPEVSLRFAFSAVAEEPSETLTLQARYEAGAVLVSAPLAWVQQWADGDEVGLYGEQSIGPGRTLRIAVEKDFQCTVRREDEPDNYEPPA